jgi:hypothetical protein
LGVIQELTGLAAQDARLRKIKTRHTTAWRKYLETGFSYWPLRAELSSRRAAWHAHALIVGFTTNFTLLNEGNEMKFGIFYEHQLPRPWHERSEFDLIQNSLDQIELAVKLGYDYAWEVNITFWKSIHIPPRQSVFCLRPVNAPNSRPSRGNA